MIIFAAILAALALAAAVVAAVMVWTPLAVLVVSAALFAGARAAFLEGQARMHGKAKQ